MSENINEIAGVEPSFKIDELKFNEKGLIPAIVQDHYSKKVLMMAWMNRESLEISLREKKTATGCIMTFRKVESAAII